jgi:DNA-binding FadR family transcriptional regulator
VKVVKALESLGILKTRWGTGLLVGEFSPNPLLESLPCALLADFLQQLEMFDVRRTLELGMFDQATLHSDEEQNRPAARCSRTDEIARSAPRPRAGKPGLLSTSI